MVKKVQKAEKPQGELLKPIVATIQEAPPTVYEAHGELLYDLAIAVGASYQVVIEPTQAGRVPKRLANKIFPLLHGSRPSYYEDSDTYLDMVFNLATLLGLLKLSTNVGQKARYQPGPKLAEWAILPTFAQVRLFLELWIDPRYRVWSDVAGAHYSASNYAYTYYMDMHAARESLMDYLSEHCQPGQWYALIPFLQQMKATHPMVLREHSRYRSYNSASTQKDVLAHWDTQDGEIIAGMLSSTLYDLGLVTLGFQDVKQPTATVPNSPHSFTFAGDVPVNPDAFCFTELGAQVIWDQPPAPEDMHARPLIVQPNFELLLLQSDYPTLYQLLPFAKVEQVDMVSRLTLTQESVRRGVEAGYAVEHCITFLQMFSQRDLPQNVLYTLQDWSKLYKDATVSQTILIEVSSEAVADELCASAKLRTLKLRRLGPGAIAVGDQVSVQVLRTTLEKEGLILHIEGDIVSVRDATPPASARGVYYGRRR